MTRRVLLSMILALAAASSVWAQASKPSTIEPQPRKDKWWMERHESFNARVKQGKVDLVLIGDSITHGWDGDGGKDVWAKYYAPRNAVNLGIGGDRTQHVLWRLQNGNLAGISPKAAVLMIGTNNSNGTDNTAEEIALGIEAIVKEIHKQCPKAKVLILAIFPRGEGPSPQREKNAQASRLAAKLADGKQVFYMDIGTHFLTPEDKLTKDIMPDLLHLSPVGYKFWAVAIEGKVREMMGECETAPAKK